MQGAIIGQRNLKKIGIYFFASIMVISCKVRPKFESEEFVQKVYERKYDSLRQTIKDSLSSGIKSVNDFDLIYTNPERSRLDSIIKAFKKESGFQIALITFDSTMLSNDSLEYVTRIVGIKNRINITVGISNPIRSMYIWNDSLINHTVLNQIETQKIIDSSFVPKFRNGEYFMGALYGIQALIQRTKINGKIKSAQ